MFGFFRSREARSENAYQDRSWGQPILDLIQSQGQSYTGISSLRNSDIFTAVRSIASDIASCTIVITDDKSNKINNNLSYLLNKRPNQYINGYFLKFILVANSLLNGESFAQIISRKGEPLELDFIKNSQCSYHLENEKLVYQVTNEMTRKSYTLQANEVLHMKFVSVNGIVGISPLIALADELASQDGSKKYVSNFFKNGAAPGGILKLNSTQMNADELKAKGDEFSVAYGGAKNSGKIAAIDQTMDFSQLQIDTNILNFLNANTFTSKQVAKAFGLPLSRMGMETTNTSTDQENNWYLRNTIFPYLNAMKSELEFKFIKPQETYNIDFDTDNIADIDPAEKLKRISGQVQWGIKTINEARRDFNLPAVDIENADKPLTSLNYTTLDELDALQILKAKTKSSKGGDDDDNKGKKSDSGGLPIEE